MWGYSESRCQKVNEKLSIVFCWGIKIFWVGDVFFSFLPLRLSIKLLASMGWPACYKLVGFYLEDQKIFVIKSKQTPSRTILHSSEMEMAPKGHIKK